MTGGSLLSDEVGSIWVLEVYGIKYGNKIKTVKL